MKTNREMTDLTYTQLLGRRSEILKRHMGNMIHKDNQYGLSEQESIFFKGMVKEFHRTKYELNSSKRK
ncbi:hypothetical protein GC093_10950 [Paenibacillus sp. LMG 31456]|uniref:Uncharacterized protein n=1 Tax=Paenibacillus foliorum TaxID=2654974 RepID=A0A972H030_9BACL|nr:hypothetical protein [Paenibacillus foliorum]NOU93736.1 hypothetical protein [Paenibacillus foliorum]